MTTSSTSIIVSVDISEYVCCLQEKFQMYLEKQPNFEEALIAIREGGSIGDGFGNIKLDSHDEGVVYRNTMYWFFNYLDKIDYQMCDEAVKWLMTHNTNFNRFMTAIINGVHTCDQEKLRRFRNGWSPISPEFSSEEHGMFHQAEYFKKFLPN